ncbi:saccharopine dehydrogenase (macronuclear) [Tetrahymena thermophila SB210]|uniref:Saccharopine dehydrogenase n=1 Tax=Tetrahymena thermophila (strain SB210) TaxID=312017 RepID=W7X7D0_TETTS|nr:saccharopine dehydrogenase [Tetrahymena thermophila SB210]EWS73277.1 saccharopine dehydrogenase [Tetrahymena thermophila SB210]|eukprot:XP_012654186.1 saccharopine dehydrogenase [Tetrahymena thermophila SB210]
MASKEHKILLLGSGLMAEAVVDYLLKRQENHIMIASNIEKDAQTLAQKKQRCQSAYVDVTSEDSLTPLISNCDLVISYVPAIFHPNVAKVCIAQKKNLVTASYISPGMAAFDEEAKKLGLTFLNEIGLDPGIDHLATMKTVDEVAEKGGKILEYESWCGGLPSPEFVDNPLGYKFSWSPIGAIGALRNDAKFLENNEVKTVSGKDLLYVAEEKDINVALRLEGYPNRDSLQYKSLYNLVDCHKVLRGTLRYSGFSTIMNGFKEIGLFENDKDCKDETWVEFLTRLLGDSHKEACNLIKQIIDESGFDGIEKQLTTQIINKALANKNYTALSEEKKTKIAKLMIKSLKHFNFFCNTMKTSHEKSRIENFVALLEKKLTLAPGETDLVVMQHSFKIQYKDSPKIVTRKSTLIMIGEKNGKSAMSVTVGTPSAIAAQLILDKVITDVGVLMPNKKSIYEPILHALEEINIRCVETEE